MDFARRRRSLVALCIAAMLGLVAVIIAESSSATVEASGGYQAVRNQFQDELAKAQARGYTSQDLLPVTDHLAAIDGAGMPVWIGDRPAFYREQAAAVTSLRRELSAREQEVLTQARQEAGDATAAAAAQVGKDRDLGVDDDALEPLNLHLHAIKTRLAGADRVVEVRGATTEARALEVEAGKVGAAQQAENDAIAAAAAKLKAQPNASADSLRSAGASALNSARNDATAAGFLDMEKAFNGIDQLNRAYGRVEKYSGKLAAGDVDSVAAAAAAVQRYGKQVHDLLINGIGGPGKAVIISLGDQELWAYEKGKSEPVLDTIVTTGRPALSTDIGPMRVLRKNAPWKMVSPWPKGSPFYYEPSDVRKVLWFTDTGEGLHDAPWRSWFGPGSNVGDGTHGCVNMPGATVDFAFDWAPVGTPVIVIPGDGKPQPQQLNEDSIDTPAGQTVKGA